MRAGYLVKEVRGSNRLGVVQEVLGEEIKVLFSKSGSEEVRILPIDNVEKMSVTDNFINQVKELN